MNETKILDSGALPWGDKRIIRLHLVLVTAYDRASRIRHLLESVAPFLVAHVNWQNPAGVFAIWHRAMDMAAAAGTLRKLLKAVLEDSLVAGHHDTIHTIINDLDNSDQPTQNEGATAPPAEPISIAELGTSLAAELPQLSDQLIEQVQRLASCGDRFEAALAASAAAGVMDRIRETLNIIDEIGLGKVAEIPADDRDNAFRREIRRQLAVAVVLLSKAAATHNNTTSVIGLTAAADRLRRSAIGLAQLRERHPRSG